MKQRQRRISARIVAIVAVLAAMLLAATSAQAATTITGAGATFPYPLYAKWAKDYQAKTGVRVNYQPIGSGGGISAIKAGTVNFGGSDAPLSKSELTSSSLVQFPMAVGGVVPIVHISGVGSGRLKLTGAVLASIYMGKITKWNHTSIKALNPGVNLPSTTINVVHRSDASGTTWIFTHYLKAVSSWSWADKTGKWPKGVGGKGNEGVCAYVQKLNNSIGYVEYAYAIQNRIAYAQMKNKAGAWVLPGLSTFTAAASNASWNWTNGFYTVLVNQRGSKSWPITGATFILVRKSQKSYEVGRAVLKYFDWCYRSSTGIADAKRLHYVPMPLSVVKKVETMWHGNVKAGSKACW